MRIFYALAHECFVLSEPIDFPHPMENGKHFVCAETKELPELAKYYLENDNERMKIANEGYIYLRSRVRQEKQIKDGLHKIGVD